MSTFLLEFVLACCKFFILMCTSVHLLLLLDTKRHNKKQFLKHAYTIGLVVKNICNALVRMDGLSNACVIDREHHNSQNLERNQTLLLLVVVLVLGIITPAGRRLTNHARILLVFALEPRCAFPTVEVILVVVLLLVIKNCTLQHVKQAFFFGVESTSHPWLYFRTKKNGRGSNTMHRV